MKQQPLHRDTVHRKKVLESKAATQRQTAFKTIAQLAKRFASGPESFRANGTSVGSKRLASSIKGSAWLGSYKRAGHR